MDPVTGVLAWLTMIAVLMWGMTYAVASARSRRAPYVRSRVIEAAQLAAVGDVRSAAAEPPRRADTSERIVVRTTPVRERRREEIVDWRGRREALEWVDKVGRHREFEAHREREGWNLPYPHMKPRHYRLAARVYERTLERETQRDAQRRAGQEHLKHLRRKHQRALEAYAEARHNITQESRSHD